MFVNTQARAAIEAALGKELPQMRERALELMSVRAPDEVIGERSDPYLERWFIARDRFVANAYLHRFHKSDDDRALHDHPWASESLILFGQYYEHTQQADGTTRKTLYGPGDHRVRTAETAHRIELVSDAPCVTLFLTGPKDREWGFHCPNGWVHWSRFVDTGNPGLPGPGCAAAGQPDAHRPLLDVVRRSA